MRRRLASLCLTLFLPFSAVQKTHAMPPYDFVHDPSFIRVASTYYVFSTGDPQGVIGGGSMQIRSSRDLHHWAYEGTVFSKIPSWIPDQVGGTVTNIWAPDISFYKGLYQVYYAGSSFGSQNSVIGLATAPKLSPIGSDIHWTDRGLVLQSTSMDDYNAIDPNFTVDAQGHPWLVFGSFWSGIQLVQLNPVTRKPLGTPPRVYHIAERPSPDALEAPSLVYRKPYYYLFTSFGYCCRGVNSTYTVHVGRSLHITGPYVDEHGNPLLQGGGSLLLGNVSDEIGPGGQTIHQVGRTFYMVYHFYDASDGGSPKLQFRTLTWTNDRWPKVGPPVILPPYY